MTTISEKLSELLNDESRIISVNYLIYNKKLSTNNNEADTTKDAFETITKDAKATATDAATDAAATDAATDAAATALQNIINSFNLVPIGITGITKEINGLELLNQMPEYMRNTDQSFNIIDDLNNVFKGSVLVGGSKPTPFKKSKKTRKNTRRYRR